MKLILFMLCLAEILCYTFCQNVAGEIASPVIILGICFAIAIISLRISARQSTAAPYKASEEKPWVKVISVTIFAGLSMWLFATFYKAFPTVPMTDRSYSDVMMTYLHLVKNFTAGHPPYEPFMNVNYVITPSYLPLQWLPFSIAEYLHFDYRWIAIGSLWGASLFFFIKSLSAQCPVPVWKILVSLWPMVIFMTLVKSNTTAFLITLESLAAGYYLLLAVALDKKRWILMAVALAVCMLSRMSIVLWAPLCMGCFFISGERKKAFLIAGICIAFFLVFYLPFLLTNPALLSNPYGSYSMAIEGIWARNVLMNGFSFNTWGMKFINGDTHHKVVLYNSIHLYVCAFTILVLGLFYTYARKKYALYSYLLFSLKIYLTVFYTFIQLPFIYLYIVPLIVTASLLSHALLKNTSLLHYKH